MVLLHQLVHGGKHELIVAHVNHGIRADSHEDETLVRETAAQYGLPYESVLLELGEGVGEEAARIARYDWLERLRIQHEATAIATAHHQDDVLETMLINLVRGTGWRGLCSLRSRGTRYRPLLGASKAEIIGYAMSHSLPWREDSTNESFKYLRNRIRHMVMPRLSAVQRQTLWGFYEAQCAIREQIETETAMLLRAYIAEEAIERYPITMVDDEVAQELLQAWLGQPQQTLRLQSLLRFARTARPGDKWSLNRTDFIQATARQLIVSSHRD